MKTMTRTEAQELFDKTEILRSRLKDAFCNITLNKYSDYYCNPSILDGMDSTRLIELLCELITDQVVVLKAIS